MAIDMDQKLTVTPAAVAGSSSVEPPMISDSNPHQRQVNYIIRHPTMNEMAGSRLLENMRVNSKSNLINVPNEDESTPGLPMHV